MFSLLPRRIQRILCSLFILSSFITGFSWNPITNLLYVRMKTGLYRYSNVRIAEYIKFRFSCDKGVYFNEYIKHTYPCQRIIIKDATSSRLTA